MGGIDVVGVDVEYGGEPVLHDVTLHVPDGEFVGIVGASGSGKTTLLRVIAGLDRVVRGQILIGGEDVTRQPPAARHLAMVFQQPALMPNRNVYRNVSFPLEIQRRHIDEIRERVGAESRALHLETLLGKPPRTLSRGESSLVQIARALVAGPRVLLLDEPFASLDPDLRHRMRAEIALLQRGYGATTLMTTNDPDDALALPSMLVVLDHGRVTQVAPPLDVRRTPASVVAARATGMISLVPVTVRADADGAQLIARGDGGAEVVALRARSPGLLDRHGESVVLAFRPEDVVVAATDHGSITAVVERLIPGTPPVAVVRIGAATGFVGHAEGLTVGERVRLRPTRFAVFDATSGAAILHAD